MSHDPNRMKIALRDNGLHSLWKGIAAYESAKADDDDVWSFKDAIMFMHHGVELLMKQILVNHSEYLVIEDLSESTVKKQKQANEEGIGVFSLQRPPLEISIEDLAIPSKRDAPLNLSNGVLGTTPGTESVRTRKEVRFKDRFDDQLNCIWPPVKPSAAPAWIGIIPTARVVPARRFTPSHRNRYALRRCTENVSIVTP